MIATSCDVGDIASNSLAGRRLLASVGDTPAISDMFTREFPGEHALLSKLRP
jgi:hypothetical protein